MTTLAETTVPSSSSGTSISDKIEESIQHVDFCPCCGRPVILTPRLICGDCGGPMPIRCQVYQSKGAWYAECLTLDLLSKGEDEVDAIRRLQVAMYSYVSTVLREGESSEGLIPRRAPLSSWLRFYWRNISARLGALVGRKIPTMICALPIQDAAALKVSHCS